MIKKIIYTAVFLFSTFSFAQIDGTNPGNAPLQILTRSNADNNKIEGSPFFEDQFKAGTLLEDDKRLLSGFFRYNVSEDKIEIKLKENAAGNEVYFLPRFERYKYQLKDYSYLVGKYQTANNGILEGYIINYFDGEHVKLFGKPTAKVSASQEAKTGYGKAKPAQIYIDQVYYLQVNGGDLQEVRLKEKDFEELLDRKPALKTYFKEHKIKELEDAKNLLSFYDKQD